MDGLSHSPLPDAHVPPPAARRDAGAENRRFQRRNSARQRRIRGTLPSTIERRDRVLERRDSFYRGDRMAKKKGGSKRKPNAAFMRPVTPSATLAEVVGSKAMPRTEVTKKLWAYIKKNGLQDKKNKRMINADPKLKAVFGGKSSVNMFAMTKLVSKHLK
jgi:chromatin remodeling complex protein RSC6